MTHYCTYFDCRYLLAGIALYRSLARHATPFTLWVLCLDEVTYDALSRLALRHLRPVRLVDLEKFDPELAAVKSTRSRVEYYFTCSPCWPLYVLSHAQEAASVTYLDADLYFFSNPQPIFDEFANKSILIVGHRFPRRLKHLERNGIFNVSFLSFRNNDIGLGCLRWWRARCLEWCYDRCENGRFADQKYLDDWPERFSGVAVLQHEGCALAPWNIEDQRLATRGGVPIVNEVVPVVFYHFHGFRRLKRWLFDPGLHGYGVKLDRDVLTNIYGPYVQELKRTENWLVSTVPQFEAEFQATRNGTYWRSKIVRLAAERKLILSVGRSVI